MEKIIIEYLIKFIDSQIKERNNSNLLFETLPLSDTKKNIINIKYQKYNTLYKDHFDPENSSPLLDEHKVIAILMICVLETGIEVISIKKKTKFIFLELTGQLTFSVMEFFLKIHYKNLFLLTKSQKYKTLSEKKLIYPIQKTSEDSFQKQFEKSLIFTTKTIRENLSVLFLSNIIFFINTYNQENYSLYL